MLSLRLPTRSLGVALFWFACPSGAVVGRGPRGVCPARSSNARLAVLSVRPGRPVAQRLPADGEHVVDISTKLAARVRMLDTGHGRKSDAHDAHSVAVAAVRAKQLRVLAHDPER